MARRWRPFSEVCKMRVNFRVCNPTIRLEPCGAQSVARRQRGEQRLDRAHPERGESIGAEHDLRRDRDAPVPKRALAEQASRHAGSTAPWESYRHRWSRQGGLKVELSSRSTKKGSFIGFSTSQNEEPLAFNQAALVCFAACEKKAPRGRAVHRFITYLLRYGEHPLRVYAIKVEQRLRNT